MSRRWREVTFEVLVGADESWSDDEIRDNIGGHIHELFSSLYCVDSFTYYALSVRDITDELEQEEQVLGWSREKEA